MSNLFLQLPIGAANGPGTPVDVSELGSLKTVVVAGSWTFAPNITIEVNNDPAQLGSWSALETFQGAGSGSFNIACRWMRANISNFKGGQAPDVRVGAVSEAVVFTNFSVPGGDGVSPAVDVSGTGPFKSLQVGGQFGGALNVEMSQDGGVTWGPVMSFQSGQQGFQSQSFIADFMRVKRVGVPTLGPGQPVVNMASSSTPGDAGAEFSPDRTLFVAKSWPAGVDPLVYFTTISDAEAQAATMSPTLTSPINILIYSGTYTEDVVCVSNVHLIGMPGLFNTRINGDITWTPGAGVNLPQTNDQESVSLSYLTVTVGSSNTLSFASATKVAGTTQLVCTECLLDVITMTSRPAALDNVFFYNSNFTGAASFTDIGSASGTTAGINIVGCRTRGLTFAGDATCRIQGGENVGPAAPTPLVLTGTAQVVIQGVTWNNPITVASGCSLTMVGSALGSAATTTLTVAAGGTADVRGTNYRDNSRLLGAGTINRTTWNDSTGATIAGANPIAFTVPYPDPFYAVQLSLIAGPGNAAATITGRTGTGFTLNDAVGGNTFDYSIIRQ